MGSARETLADFVYLPWWYSGQVVNANLFPSPRPSPDAQLSISYPAGAMWVLIWSLTA